MICIPLDRIKTLIPTVTNAIRIYVDSERIRINTQEVSDPTANVENESPGKSDKRSEEPSATELDAKPRQESCPKIFKVSLARYIKRSPHDFDVCS